MSKESDEVLGNIVSSSTAIFGIFVGQDPKGKSKLRDITKCGLAQAQQSGHSRDDPCNFYASTEDFDELQERAHDVAKSVTQEADVAACLVSGIPWLMMCYPFLALPCILWWCYGTINSVRRHYCNNDNNNCNYDNAVENSLLALPPGSKA